MTTIMTIEQLQASFCNQEIQRIIPLLADKNGTSRLLSLTGLVGSAYPMIAAKTIAGSAQKHLFILSSKERAAFFFNDLEKLLDDRNKPLTNKLVHYLPSSFKRAHTTDEIDNSNVKLRSEIVNKLTNHPERPCVIVTYPEAIAEKVVTQQFLNHNSFIIKQGSEIPTDIFLNFLYEFEYLQEDFVFEPGQFAWRGSIFDIFSFSEEYPYRIELAGEHSAERLQDA